jgi:hypothetical protein
MAHSSIGYMHALTRIRTPTCPGTLTHTNMKYLLHFLGNSDPRTRLSLTLYVHCLSYYSLTHRMSSLSLAHLMWNTLYGV